MNLLVPVILCGGSGSRLWPVTQGRPKHFVRLISDLTLLQETAQRVINIIAPSDIIIVTLESMKDEAEEQLNVLNLSVRLHFVTEPQARNTAAAVALATLYAEQNLRPDTTLWFTPADHYIGDEAALKHALNAALVTANKGFLSIFGITPSRPETGYGYIHPGEMIDERAYRVETFVEKPDLETAQSYMANGYLWNSGMILSDAATLLDQLEIHAPEILSALRLSGNDAYDVIAAIPFDKAVLEKSDTAAVIPCDPDWSDIGTMEGLSEVRARKNIPPSLMETAEPEGSAVKH